MSREHVFLDEFGHEEDGKPLWKPKDVASEPEAKLSFLSGAPPPAGSCEFAGRLPYEGALCRQCLLGSVCFLFADPVAYACCPSRTMKLRELKKGKT